MPANLAEESRAMTTLGGPSAPARRTRARRGGVRSLCLLLGLVLGGIAAPTLADSVEVITSPDRAGIPIDRMLLRALFTMRVREWPDGKPAQVFVLPDSHEVHARFLREQLGTYPYVLRGAWDRMVFTGTGFAPTLVNSEQEMREKVQSTPGAIGYATRPAPQRTAPGGAAARRVRP